MVVVIAVKKPDEESEKGGTGHKEEESESFEVNSLGMVIHKSKYQLIAKKSIKQKIVDTIKINPAFAISSLFLGILVVFTLAFFDKFAAFQYLAMAVGVAFMFWISVAEDARMYYKYLSVASIFLCLIIFLMLTVFFA